MFTLTQLIFCGLIYLSSRPLTGAAAYPCVSSCAGLPGGDYQSCNGCNVYVTCSNGIIYDNRPCAANLVWDDYYKVCTYTSSTCTGSQTTTTTEATTTTNSTCDCCVEGELRVNLTTAHPGTSGTLDNVTVSGISGPWGGSNCSRNIRIAADFDTITEGGSCDGVGCYTTPPFCHKRMLKVVLYLLPNPDPSNSTRAGRLVNVGDSLSNNGGAGDASTQQNDAEADGLYPNIHVYESDKCSSSSIDTAANVLLTNNQVTLFIGNEYIRIQADDGTDLQICSECLFALNGQSDSSSGGINERIYVGINRIVSSNSFRRGRGVCGARISWACNFD